MRAQFLRVGVCFVILSGILPGSLYASYIYDFEIFTDNGDWGTGGPNYGDTQLDLFVEVYNGLETVSFKFHNQSSVSASVTDIYFDNGTLLQISGIENGPGTDFSMIASPSDLPGGNLLDPPFVTTEQFSADPAPPPAHNGIEGGEWVIVNFDLDPDGTLENVIDELNTQTLRIGVHLQDFSDGSSESAINVPEPATVLFVVLGVLALRKRG